MHAVGKEWSTHPLDARRSKSCVGGGVLFTSSKADSVVVAIAAAIESLVVSHECGRDPIT